MHWGFVHIIHYLSYFHNSSDQNVLSPTWTGCIFLQKEGKTKFTDLYNYLFYYLLP